jgi:hypothetical protein
MWWVFERITLCMKCIKLFEKFDYLYKHTPVSVPARSKAYVYGRSPAAIVGSNPTGGMDVCLLYVLCVVGWRSL